MNRHARWALFAVTTLIAAAGAAVGTGSALATSRIERTVDVAVRPVALPTDAASVARGQYLYGTRGCVDCHGSDGAGRTFIDDGRMKVAGPQIAPGPGSATAAYRVEDWVRTVRHGVKPSGRPLLIMPSQDYNRLTDADLGALIAYVRQMPPVNGSPAVLELPLAVRVLYGFGAIPDAAALIDHSLPPEPPVAEGATVEHGRYVAHMCEGCHGPKLAGGKVPGGPPDWPPSANLTPGEGGVMGRYASADDFVRMMRSGKRADGSAVRVMPFESLSAMNDTDLRGLHAYLQTLPAQAAGAR